MKARAVRINDNHEYEACPQSQASHVELNIPGPTGRIYLPMTIGNDKPKKGWAWNGDTKKPTLLPSILTTCGTRWKCHSFVTDGRIRFLQDSTHEYAGQTIDLLDLPPRPL